MTQPIKPLDETVKQLTNWLSMEPFDDALALHVRSALHHLEAGKEERERCEEALGWALALIASEDAHWANSKGFLMAERALAVLQERMGKPVQLPHIHTPTEEPQG